MHLTGGILCDLRTFSYTKAESCSQAESTPSRQQVTQTVRLQVRAIQIDIITIELFILPKITIHNSYNIWLELRVGDILIYNQGQEAIKQDS